MPTYEWKCHRDGFRYSTVSPVTELDTMRIFCEECGAEMTRVFNAPGIVFKGTGFYRTDSRKSGE